MSILLRRGPNNRRKHGRKSISFYYKVSSCCHLNVPKLCLYSPRQSVVSWGCYHKVAWTAGCLMNNNIYFSGSGAARPRSGCQHGRFLARALSWVADCCLLLISSHGGKREKEPSRVPTMRALIPFMRASPS